MNKRDTNLVWTAVGGMAAMALGVALIPLRAATSASNLAFAFLILTIVVAELGGRTAALVTAVLSALSLNFFLTQPYLSLTIDSADDIVAFLALAVSGLIVAWFGTRRARWTEIAERTAAELDVLSSLAAQLRSGQSLDEIMGFLKRRFGLGALVLRDDQDRVLCAVPAGSAAGSIPEARLSADTLLPQDEGRLRFGTSGLRLPEGGGRLRLQQDRGSLSFDLWEGNAQGFSLDESRTLTIALSILGLHLSRQRAR